MKRALIALLFLVLCNHAKGQQQPQYTQYIFNQLLVNPAVSGIENYVDLKAGYRSQWTGLTGAPVTNYITITAPLGHNYIQGDAMQVPAEGGNTGRGYVDTYRASDPHHGIGLTILTDKAGPIRQTNINATYAYHLGLSPSVNLSAGVSAGLSNFNLNTAEVSLENALDPAVYSGNTNQFKPNVNAGVWLYSSEYFAGIAAQQILTQTLNFANNSAYNQGKTVPHFYITAGYKFFLSDDVSLLPSVMYKIVRPAQNTIDINAKMSFRDRFWIGGSYRQSDAVAGMMGFTISSFLSLGYSYDYTTSNLNTVSTGTHELVLGIHFGNNGSFGGQHDF